MAVNSFGNIFRITTWGESHGKAIGVVIDGCPAGIEVTQHEIQAALSLRAPGKNPYTTPRAESDQAEILSGVFEGKTTGTPICMLIANQDADPSKYEPIKDILRPGHANYTYLEKYGTFDYKGGGRASARETACRVAAGTIAKKLLEVNGIKIAAYIKQIGEILAEINGEQVELLLEKRNDSPVYCPDSAATEKMMKALDAVRADGDSLGGIVEFLASPVPTGLGDPIYEKLEARLALAMMSIPASKGFEIGSGFGAVFMRGSEHNDAFIKKDEAVAMTTNHAGGILGGISNGMPIVGRVAFKPTSSIKKPQNSLDLDGNPVTFKLPEGSRHDPCVAIRAVPVVEAMAAIVLADALLLNRCSRQ